MRREATAGGGPEARDRARRWLRWVGTAVLVGLAANYVVHSFPLDEVVIVYDRY